MTPTGKLPIGNPASSGIKTNREIAIETWKNAMAEILEAKVPDWEHDENVEIKHIEKAISDAFHRGELAAYERGVVDGMNKAASIIIHERPLFGQDRFQAEFTRQLADTLRDKAAEIRAEVTKKAEAERKKA